MFENYIWSPISWSDFEWWLDHDKEKVKRIRRMIKEIVRDPFIGIGKPEPLKEHMAGMWSRRITDEHRLVYVVCDGELRIV
ncbi:Txe/YoeB family addiction module toxin [Fructobacillus broussonetiae]|uniref:Txe/YoeB family addiction module toxin n=1 Tax=Fructobacillus broussonetiae TaxID=2713173 RepID=UPI003B75B62F